MRRLSRRDMRRALLRSRLQQRRQGFDCDTIAAALQRAHIACDLES